MKVNKILSRFCGQLNHSNVEKTKQPPSVVLTSFRALPDLDAAENLISLEQAGKRDFLAHSSSRGFAQQGPTEFENNILDKLILHQEKRYGRAAVETAKRWGRPDDVASVSVVVNALGHEGLVDLDHVYLHRTCLPKYLNMEESSISNNPFAVASISNQHNLDYRKDFRMLRGQTMKAKSLPHGGINFLVSNMPNIDNHYCGKGYVNITCSLRDAFNCGGKFHSDIGAAVSNAVILELPQNAALPFVLV